MTTTDEADQHVAWRMRIVSAIVNREHDDQTLIEMVHAGFNQAHSEGLSDAAWICETVASERPDSARVASVLAGAIRELDRLNRQGRE